MGDYTPGQHAGITGVGRLGVLGLPLLGRDVRVLVYNSWQAHLPTMKLSADKLGEIVAGLSVSDIAPL